MGGKKFKAKVISGGGMYQTKVEPQEQRQTQAKPVVDYMALMERSFGEAMQSNEEKPPLPSDASEYLVNEENCEDNCK